MKKLGFLFLIMSVFALLNSTVWSYPFPVPDTGQTTCYNSTNQIICPQPGEPFYGQDAQYTINPPSYVTLTGTGPTGPDTITKSDLITVAYPVPESDFTAIPCDGTVPLTVNFTSLSTGTITEWLWEFGDDHISTEENPAHIYRIPGTFSVSLTVINSDGLDIETKTDYIDVFPCSYEPVRIMEEYYVSIQEAYDHALDGDMIQCQAIVFAEELYFDRDISVTVKGGYGCGYSTIEGDTRIKSITIGSGTISVEKLTLFTSDVSKPTATTGAATAKTSNSASLNGAVNPNGGSTIVLFEYGTTTSYGNAVVAAQSPLSGKNERTVDVSLTGLQIGTTYHFRVKATNSAGTTYGDDTFFIALPVLTPGGLPDTGQTRSYTSAFGEDSDYLINPPSYTKLDGDGNDLSDSAASWVMVRDNVTGLIWEAKTSDGSIHDRVNQYTWQNAQNVFIAELNTRNFGGHPDWRVPTIKELASITRLSGYRAHIDYRFFPNQHSNCWSSTPYADDPRSFAWVIDFRVPDESTRKVGTYYYVRAVRGGPTGTIEPFTINVDGTVTDKTTGLMWKKGALGRMTWAAAISHCEALSFAGYDDWRLPNRRELRSIVDYSEGDPAINTDYFPNTSFYNNWTSTFFADDYDMYSWSWYINFFAGVSSYWYTSRSYTVRAVRGGQNRLLDHLVIYAPGQASTWDVGASMNITWDRKGMSGNVKISISQEGGKEGTFETIAASTENDGEYNWIVTGPGSVNCMLKIEPLSDPEKGTVQGLFSIVD